LIMWWLMEGKSETEWFAYRARIEVPPRGYTGSLVGTSWDDGVILEEYGQASGSITRS